jgi:hypothetical protein
MFKVKLIGQRIATASSAKRAMLQYNTNKTFIAARQQQANMHDFTVKVSFPVENVEEFKKTIETKGQGQHVDTLDFQVTYYDSVPKHVQLKSGDDTKSSTTTAPEGKELYTLSKRDIWLRQVNDVWHCMSPYKDTAGRSHLDKAYAERVPHYDEQNGEKEIRRMLNLQQDMTREAREGIKMPSLADDLKERMAVVPYANFTFKQDMYSLPDHFVLELFNANFGYTVANIHSIVRNGTELDLTNRCTKLLSYLQSIGVDMEKHPATRSLILEYIARNNAEQYKALQQASIVP